MDAMVHTGKEDGSLYGAEEEEGWRKTIFYELCKRVDFPILCHESVCPNQCQGYFFWTCWFRTKDYEICSANEAAIEEPDFGDLEKTIVNCRRFDKISLITFGKYNDIHCKKGLIYDLVQRAKENGIEPPTKKEMGLNHLKFPNTEAHVTPTYIRRVGEKLKLSCSESGEIDRPMIKHYIELATWVHDPSRQYPVHSTEKSRYQNQFCMAPKELDYTTLQLTSFSKKELLLEVQRIVKQKK